ncbi:hypothetical protein ACFQH6_14570 [Halobacteriaceae archaeon GCM10025711]
MNKHFEDARYYLSRALDTAKAGVREELEPLEERFREMTGREEEPEPGRLDKLQEELKTLESRAEGDARKAISDARQRITDYRSGSE